MTTNQPVADFAIFQNSRTRVTGLWVKEKGEWVEAEDSEFEIFALIARLIRVSPNPNEILEGLKLCGTEPNKPNIDVPNKKNQDFIPGFFVPPEALDGLE
jgi:hypothetical protein